MSSLTFLLTYLSNWIFPELKIYVYIFVATRQPPSKMPPILIAIVRFQCVVFVNKELAARGLVRWVDNDAEDCVAEDMIGEPLIDVDDQAFAELDALAALEQQQQTA